MFMRQDPACPSWCSRQVGIISSRMHLVLFFLNNTNSGFMHVLNTYCSRILLKQFQLNYIRKYKFLYFYYFQLHKSWLKKKMMRRFWQRMLTWFYVLFRIGSVFSALRTRSTCFSLSRKCFMKSNFWGVFIPFIQHKNIRLRYRVVTGAYSNYSF